MRIMKTVNDFVWNTHFWLPSQFTWEEINEFNHFSFESMILRPVLVAILIYIIRTLFENIVAAPIGKFLKVKDKKKFIPNAILETQYRENAVLTESVHLFISKQTGLKVDYIKEWFETRRQLNRPSKLQKFKESCWRFVFYLSIWIYGLRVLYNKPWLWDTKECWINYPRQIVTDDIYWYYVIEMSFYLSLLVSQFYDVRRKDFWQMFLHHIVTILLLFFSYICNFTRLGSIVLLLHDCSDFLLEIAKMGTYAKLKLLCDSSFVLFTLTWFFTRLVAYPMIILYTTTNEATKLMGLFPAYYLFNVLLYILQVMHVIWFYMILRSAYRALIIGGIEDDRSESDPSELDEQKLSHKNK